MPSHDLSTNQRIVRAWVVLALVGLLVWLTQHARGAESEVTVSIVPSFRGRPLVFDQACATNAAGQAIAVTRLDMLLSGIAVRRKDGTWLEKHNWFAYLNGRTGRTNFVLRGLPAGAYDRLRFNIGVPLELNHANPSQWDSSHPLNPLVNGLHWNWQGDYVFLALEGKWSSPSNAGARPAGARREQVNKLDENLAVSGLSHPSPALGLPGEPRGTDYADGFSWHLATERQLMAVEVPVPLSIGGNVVSNPAEPVRLVFDLAAVFGELTLDSDTSSTHSREGDELADWLRGNIERAFTGSRAGGSQPPSVADSKPKPAAGSRRPEAASPTKIIGTPYRFTMSSFFPKPALPADNPLTVEGVELGRRLFNEPLLSKGGKQSCASCHQMDGGTVDAGRAFSLGVDGLAGKRNAMPLYNLAWKSEFFWDGRAKSLRQQALMPIQDELEMHETLPNVVAKLKASTAEPAYPALFAGTFGTPDITAERVGLAVEQFLLTVTSFDAKFDRVMRGEAKFTTEEQLGFELFHTEHDPRRGQFGADCFHCHGGPLFQNVAFANNGLDAAPSDLGRYLVTQREGDQGKFSVPSLRNVELTAPYMHDGRFPTLEAAVFHYVRGVRRSPTLDPNLAKHPPGGVRLPPEDLHALVAFLKTLTEESLRPVNRRTANVPSP